MLILQGLLIPVLVFEPVLAQVFEPVQVLVFWLPSF